MNLKKAMKYTTVLILSTVVSTTFASVFTDAATAVDDTVITTKVEAAFTKESMLSPLSIKVKTKNGVVILKGKVDTVNQYERAISVSKSVNCVKDVDSKKLKWKSLF